MGYYRKIKLERQGGCLICTSHSVNKDGYLRVRDYRNTITDLGAPRMVMHHRLSWEGVHGPIPRGYEIDHKCRNRGCQDVTHMQMLTIAEHKAKTNIERANDNRGVAWEEFEKGNLDIGAVSSLLGHPRERIARWRRQWRKLKNV